MQTLRSAILDIRFQTQANHSAKQNFSMDTIDQAFKARAQELLETPIGVSVYFYIELAIFGKKKLEVDPETWPMIEGLISHVWVSESVPFPEVEEPLEPSTRQSTIGTEVRPESTRPLQSNIDATASPVSISLSVDHEFPHLEQVLNGQIPPANVAPATAGTGNVATPPTSQSTRSTSERPDMVGRIFKRRRIIPNQ